MNAMPLLPAQTLSGVNRIHHADAVTLLRSLPDNSIDLIVTSPPYDNLRTYNGYSFNFELIARDSYRVLKQGGVLVWVVGDATVNGSETLTSFRQSLYFKDVVGFRSHQTLIWEKSSLPGVYGKRCEPIHEFMFVMTKGAPNTFNPPLVKTKYAGAKVRNGSRVGSGWVASDGHHVVKETKVDGSIWKIDKGRGRMTTDGFEGKHPAMFPEELAERHILTWSNPGDIVLDYFGGSGTTAKMARNNLRQYITCDISAEYCEIMRKRLAQPFTLPLFAVTA